MTIHRSVDAPTKKSVVHRFDGARLAVLLGLLLILAGALTGCDKKKKDEKAKAKSGSSKTTSAELKKKAKAGAKIFEKRCVSCHTIGGGPTTGPDLEDVHQRREREWLERWLAETQKMLQNDEAAKKMLEKFNNVPMPNQNLSETEIDQVLAHIKLQSKTGGDGGDKKELELADDIKGRSVEQFVSSECGGCHNPKRTGATGPKITKKRLTEGTEKLNPMNRKTLIATIAHGRPGTSMPAWSTPRNPIMESLSDPEINKIAHHLLNEAAPEEFKFGMGKMKKTHEVLVPKSERPDEPTHDYRVDDLLLVTEREDFGMAVIDGDKLEVVDHLEAGARAHGYTFHPNGRYAYNLGRDGWLYMYDLYTLEAVTKVRVGMDARGIAISDDGKYLLTGMYIPTQAVMLNAETLEPLKIFDTHDVKGPSGEKVDSRICSVNDVSPKKVGPYFLMALKEGGQVWRINYEKEGFPVEQVMNVGKILHDGFLSPDNETFFLASQNSNHVAAVDVETMEIQKKIETGTKPHPGPGATWEADGTTYAATPHIGDSKNVIWDVETMEIAGEVPSGAPGLFVRANPHMKYVWFDSLYDPKPEEITVHKKSKPFEVVKRITDGVQTLHPEPDADGDYVFVSDWKDEVVRVYDDESLELVETLEDVTTPTGIFSVSRRHETEGH